MGIIYKYKKLKNLDQYSNKNVRAGFYSSLIFFGEQKSDCNVNVHIHLLGKRGGFCIVNSEHYIEMLKRATKFFHELAKKQKKILYVNDSLNTQFDGIIKAVSYRSNNTAVIGRWPCGILTKNSNLKIAGLVVFDPKKSYFAIKESTKLGLPIISLNSTNSNPLKVMYPIICNNLQGDSLFFNIVILSHFFLEGSFFAFLENARKTK